MSDGKRSAMRQFACALAIVALGGCSGGGRKTVAIEFSAQHTIYVAANGRTLHFAVSTCHGKPTTRVVETARQVHLLVTSDTSSSDKCADGGSVTLHEPLGSRTVIDDKTGKPISVRRLAA
ncbi:MAG: hypothetical protein QOJ71_3246 [Actinomycetota bacterium]|nr:hypothetical protein [Actinomycetota bacterium]